MPIVTVLSIVIDGGEIVERGNHRELLAKNGVYAHLYETQFLSAETMPSYVPAS